VSSATLAANNHYTLDEPVLQMVVEKHQQEEADAQKAVEMRKMAAELKQAERQKKLWKKSPFIRMA
jgi:Cdc6-like AAA superfamily ATPase